MKPIRLDAFVRECFAASFAPEVDQAIRDGFFPSMGTWREKATV